MNIPELTEAIWFSNIEETRQILSKLNPKELQRDKEGNSVLHLCVRANAQPELFQLLLPYASPALRNQSRQLAEDLFEDYKFGPLYREELDFFVAQKIRRGELIDLEDWVLKGWKLPDFDQEEYQSVVKENYLSSAFFINLRSTLQTLRTKVIYVHHRVLTTTHPEISVADFKFIAALDSTGYSAIHKAVLLEKVDLVATLLSLKPDLAYAKDYLGNSPLAYSHQIKNKILQSVLFQQGAEVKSEELNKTERKLLIEGKQLIMESLETRLDTMDEPDISDIHNMFLRPGSGNAAQQQPSFMTADARYVFEAVGNPLVLALSEIVQRQPSDPIDYLAQYLLTYGDAVDIGKLMDQEFDLLKAEKKRKEEETAIRKAMEEERKAQLELEDRMRREELERKRATVPVSSLKTQVFEERNKDGATALHIAVRSGCSIEAFLDLVHQGHSFVARDALGRTVRDVAMENKNDLIVKEIDNIIIHWIKESNKEAILQLLMNAYSGSLPNLKKAFGSKLKGIPEGIRKMVDDIPKQESSLRELWKLSSVGPPEHLETFLQSTPEEELMSKNKDGLCCLHMALLHKNLSCAKVLVEKCPDLISLTDNLNRVALHYAFGAGTDFVKLIKAAGGQDTVKDALGNFPKYYAQRFDLLPEAPNYGSPQVTVTEEDSPPQEASEQNEVDDANKLTPITEDDNEA